ncbi:tandem-95 repeat protein [Mesorhizobium loti]|nr:tandem-95 repeat protein [Mesorhizobium loti]
MTTNIELDSFSGSLNEHSAPNEHGDQTSPAEIRIAQANSTQQPAPAASEPVPVDVGGGAPVKPEAPAEAKAPPAAAPHEYVADASHVVRLPANASIDNIKVDGQNLVLEQADGSVIVIKDGALNVPTFIIGDVEVPRVALLAALEASHVDVAFGADGSISAGPGGSNSSAGGDFSVPPGGIGDGFDLSALLPPTALQFGLLDRRELFPSIVDREVTVTATSLLAPSEAASETGLDGGPTQSPGSDAPSHSETSGTGTISIEAPDGIGSIVINGVTVTAVGDKIPGEFGYITIVSFNPTTGAIEYNYTVTESVTHSNQTNGFDPTDTVPDNFSITVTDVDGDSASTSFAVAIVDDVPTAVADSGTQATENAPVTVNVFANDVPGADGVNITDPAKVSYVANSLSGGAGTVTYHNDGTFTYAPVAGEEGTVTFQYQIIDGDGDSSIATVTINLLKDSTPTIGVAPEAPDASGHSAVNEAGLAVRGIEPAGSGEIADNNGTNNSDPSETATGSLNITTGGDTIGHLYVTDKDNTQIEVTNAAGGILVHGQYGDLTITGTPGTGYTYSYTLLDNTSGNTTHDDFAVQVVDTDGDPASTTLTINIVDDVPTAHDDSATQATENAAVTVNVFANDVPGADGVAIADPAKVSYVANSLSGGAGTVTYHNDGTFTYAPVAGEEGTVTFQYQIIDGDGDSSVATVTINLLKDSTPTIDVTPEGGTPSVNATAVVDEKGLPAGTGELADPALNSDHSETTVGTFNITTGGDTLQKLEVMDKDSNLVDVTSGGTVQGVNGVLTVSLSAGVYSYSYTLSNNVANANPNQTGAADQATGENFAVKVTDSDNDTANASLTVKVNDDGPVAVNDGQAATEGGAAIVATAATGVLANDHVGADQPGTVTAVTGGTIGNPIVTTYGTLTLNGDGSYIYTPKASVPAGTVDSFTYTMKDADGDTSQAVLSFTFSGDNNHATAGVSATLVDEDNLATGNNDNALGDDAPSAQPGTLTHNYGVDGAGHIALVSGSETVNGTTYTYTANGAGTQIIASAGGVNVFQVDLTNAVTGTYTVTLLSPIQHPTAGTEDNLGFNLSYKVYDADDTAATAATGTLTVTVDDDIPVAVNDGQAATEGGAAIVATAATGVLANDHVGADQPGTVTAVTGGTIGNPIVTTYGTLTLNGDGSYIYTPKASVPAGTVDSFTYTMKDADGDTSQAVLSFTFSGDNNHATAGVSATLVDEDNLATGNNDNALGDDAPSAQPGTLTHNYGADGAGHIALVSGSETVNGTTYTYTANGAGTQIIASAGGVNVFQVDLTNAVTGTYTVTLLSPIQHPTAGTEDNLGFNLSYKVYDADDTAATAATGTLTVTVDDDIPVAVNDGQAATEGGAAIVATAATGVLANDHVGADQPGTVTAVTGGTIGNPIVTTYGTLTLNGDGSYIYTPKASVPAGTVDSFTYTMKDADGDTSQAVLSFTFSGDNSHATAGVSATLVDEDNLATGNNDNALGDDAPSAQPGTLTHNYGVDGAGHIALVSGSETVNGTTYTYTANGAGTQIIASAGGVNVFQVDLTNAVTGTYTVTLLSPIQHPTAGTEDNLGFNLSYKVYDADDTAATAATGTLTVTVDDDIPVAVNDGQAATEGGAAIVATAATGVLANDHVGADQPGTVTAVTGGTIGNPIVTTYGTLTLNGDGSYIYTPKASVPAGTVDSFTYTMKDADGDTSQAVLSFTFSGDNNHATAGVSATLVDEDNLATGNNDNALGDDAQSAQPGTLTHNYGVDGAGHIALVSGSETVNGTTYTYTANGAGTQIIASAGGVNVFQVDLTNAVTGTYTVTLLSPIQHPTAGTEDNLGFNLSYKVYDADDTAATAATGTLTVTVDDDIPVAVNDGQAATEGGAAIVATAATGVLANDHVGADQPGTVTAVTGGTIGNPIVTAYGTLTLNGDGSYIYTPKASVPAGTVDSFTYTMKDADGDTSQAVLSFTFSGDNNHATAGVSATLVDEDNLATGNNDNALGDDAQSAQPGTLTHNYGADGAGHIALVSGSETVNGTTYTYTANGAGTQIIASAGGVNVFQVDLTNAVTGTYTVTLLSPIQHPTAGTEDNLGFNLSYKVYDADDTAATAATGTLTVTVDDDIPVAVNDGQAATEGGAAIVATAATGVLANDHVGADQPGTVTAVTGGTIGNPIVTAYGTLTLNGDGSYIYTPKASVPAGTVDSFTYTMKDADGDTSQAVLSFTFSGDNNHATAGVSATLVDEDNLATGNNDNALGDDAPSAQPGTLTHNYGADGAGHIALVSGSETVNGTTYTYTANGAGTQIIASAGGVNVFQVDLTNAVTGTYTVTLLSPIQHPTAGTEDNLGFNLSYKVYDADDTAATAATGTLTVTVDDDIPVAVNDGQAATEGGAAIVATAATGVLANDHVGADQPGTVTAVTGGTIGNPIVTAYGTLTLNGDGSYIYTPKASVPAGTVDSFTYTMKDADGDTSQAVLSFTFSGDNNHATAGVSATLVDEDNLATGNNDNALGDDAPSAQPGTLTHNYGVDGAGHIALVSGSETVNGTTYTYTANGAGTQIIASAGGVNVFQVDLTNAVTGTYTVTLLSPIQHPTAGTEDNLGFNLSYKVYDADDTAATAATGTLTVTVDDDIPVAKVVAATPVLDDDAQALFTGNPGGTGDVADAKVLSGSAGSLFTAGADGLKALSFAGPSVMAIYKTPNGLAAQEGVQYATTTNAGHTILTATGVISGSIVFVLDVAPDGSYAFTLSEPLVHPTVGTTEETMNVTIGFTVTDGDSDTANGSLTVQVNDDTPTFTHITNGIVANQDNNVVVGTHDLAFGADGEQSIEITPLTNISGLTYLPVVHNADGSSDLIAQAGGSNFFDLKVSADGTYTFTLIESRPVANQTFDFSGVSGGASTIQFTLGDATFKAVDTNGNGSIGNAEELKPTSNGFGVQNGNLDVGEQFQINFATAIDKLNFFVEHEAAGAFTMTYTTNTGLTGTATTAVDGLLTIDPTGDFTSITFTVTEGKAKFDNFGYSKLILPSDQTFNFSVSGVDGDGDHSANQTLSITTLGEHPAGTPISGTAGDEAMAGTSGNDIINGLAGNDTLFGGSGADQLNGGANDDLLIGGFGQDTLTGGTGADTFKLDHLELNIKDLIIDYNKGEGDQIDLTALFDKGAGTIADYVHYDTSTKTLSVDTDGSGNAASFVDVATLQNGPATSGTINILYDDTAHTQHTATI